MKADESIVEATVVVRGELGLHARPAAAFVQTAARYRATIQISNLSSERGPASARSLLAILGLGVRQGHRVRLRAEGEDASQALSALSNLLECPACTTSARPCDETSQVS